MNINRWTRGNVIIPGHLSFGGGYPKFRWLPYFAKWGRNLTKAGLDAARKEAALATDRQQLNLNSERKG